MPKPENTSSSSRKRDHINLAFESQTNEIKNDTRFFYEPALSAHQKNTSLQKNFLNKQVQLPIWISSMTGGTQKAGKINHNLARACNEFGIGMGLGSCRSLLTADTYFDDFNLRPIIGNNLPFFANLGIAQIEMLVLNNEVEKIKSLVLKLKADGLIIHINPLQEFLQPEGDNFRQAPVQSIQMLLNKIDFPVIVKEVGQGMGPQSLKALLKLPLAAIDFGAYGGTNFSRVEILRNNDEKSAEYRDISYIGHTANEMTDFVNAIVNEEGNEIKCKEIIISGGIKNFLDGYYYINKIKLNAIYAQGSAFLKHAQKSYAGLQAYIKTQADGLALCNSFVRIKE